MDVRRRPAGGGGRRPHPPSEPASRRGPARAASSRRRPDPPLDIFGDEAAALAAIEELHGERPLAAIVTALDVAVPFTARAARMLGLPGLSEETSFAVRDKREMRRRLEQAGLNTPRLRGPVRP
ncbi:hypothetical protein Shyd_56260 [Streptomyces hydrogenans]|uniref:BL00235/CARNS1 N-terminal domain-containing protein n=1 Tax=Streptomyces hydrogenans TaxID=1873719 RepID=A0ABQ3PGV5_9ACTN|nr:hypothetical protein [Streptomyces hydrogenans]GHI24255.1 hypothetical protein Shyd_56260 [Streptomyces hydrogenans]